MKMLFSIGGSFALSALLLTAHAQTPATTHDNPTPAKPLKTADQRAATYQGPKVTKDSKALGKKMVQKSKPADMRMRVPVQKVK
jgi:hypothetical protein